MLLLLNEIRKLNMKQQNPASLSLRQGSNNARTSTTILRLNSLKDFVVMPGMVP